MISIGKIVEYLDNGKFICGFITDNSQKRVHLLNHNKREMKLPVSRILHCSSQSFPSASNREQLYNLLTDIHQKRNSLAEKVNLEEIWELVIEEDSDVYNPQFLAELAFGEEADDDRISALLRAVLINKIYFKYKEGNIKVHSREQVEKLIYQANKEREKQALIDEGSRILKAIHEESHTFDTTCEQTQQILSVVQGYYLFGEDSDTADIAKKILSEAGLKRPHDAFHLLVKTGIWKKHENIPLLRSSLSTSFSLSAIQQAEAMLQQSTDLLFEDSARQDLTALKPITIDGVTTLDFDDALTIEQTEDCNVIGVHISDVAHYVKPGDPLFLEAMNRGTSVYFPQTQIPMLPRHLSQGICSLIQGEIRATMSFMIYLTDAAEVKKVRIFPSIIKVARRLTYEQADAMIEDDAELKKLSHLATAIRKKRIENGALLLPFPDVNIHVDASGKVHVSLAPTDTPARILVSEMMILANQEAARYVSDRMVPGLFRAQEPPKQKLVNGEDNDLYLNTRQRKQLSRGELLTVAKRHAGLGVNQYTTVTSPIRRLLDLVMQHQLHSIVRRREPQFTADMCKDFSSIITRTLSQANAVKQQRHRYWLLVYLHDRIGHHLEALVIEAGPRRTLLLLKDILFDLELPTPGGKKVTPGTTVKVRVSQSNPRDNTVSFDWG